MKKTQRKRRKQAANLTPKGLQIRDLNNREVFRDPVLCAQFLRDYTGISLLKDIRPEDIEDVSQKYQAYLGTAFESDTVKKIRLRNTDAGRENIPLYMISLIEHKSNVDYNVSMQLLKYMVCIWNEYAREMERETENITSRKNFRYPPILPVVYYEGTNKWTADLHLKDRIMLNDTFGDYLPDFTYKLVRIHDYTNGELLDRKDEMSLLMMINKANAPDEIRAFWKNIPKDKIDAIIKNTPYPTLEVIASVAWNLLMKLNVPPEEAGQYIDKIKERQMGYWFENMEKLDIQEERRKTEEQRKKAEEQRKKAEEHRRKAEEQQERAEEQQKRAEEAERKLKEKEEQEIRVIVSLCQRFNAPKEETILQVMENYNLSYVQAREKVDLYLNT